MHTEGTGRFHPLRYEKGVSLGFLVGFGVACGGGDVVQVSFHLPLWASYYWSGGLVAVVYTAPKFLHSTYPLVKMRCGFLLEFEARFDGFRVVSVSGPASDGLCGPACPGCKVLVFPRLLAIGLTASYSNGSYMATSCRDVVNFKSAVTAIYPFGNRL